MKNLFAPPKSKDGDAVGVRIKRADFAGRTRPSGAAQHPPRKHDGYFGYRSRSPPTSSIASELDMVPPTVERRYNGETVSLQLWGEDLKMLKEVQEKKLGPTNPSEVGAYTFQLRRQKVFHNLAGNLDPNQGNIMFDPVWNVVLADFSRAFTNTQAGVRNRKTHRSECHRSPFLDRFALDRRR
jgi:hypothetical protein